MRKEGALPPGRSTNRPIVDEEKLLAVINDEGASHSARDIATKELASNYFDAELESIEARLAELESKEARLQSIAEKMPGDAGVQALRENLTFQAQPLQYRKQEIQSFLEAPQKVAKTPLDRRLDALNARHRDAVKLKNDLQPELDFLAEVDGLLGDESKATKPERERSKLLPARYTNRDFFLADILDHSIKDDAATMEAPIYSLSTQKDFTVWKWTSKDGSRSVVVSPSVEWGRATMHDKDVLIFVTSQMTEALNRERPDAQNRTVRFTAHNYLVATNKSVGGVEYDRLEKALDRLKGTTIKTTIRTGEKQVREAFGIIDNYTIVERSPDDDRMIAIELVVSKWLMNAIQAHEVLTLHPDYFRLRKPLERRLYELARKHCGSQSSWKIGLELLKEKCGARSHLRAFRDQVQSIADADTLPEYRMVYSREADQVIFYTNKTQKLISAIGTGKSQLSIKR